jgi:hypothetical protein
MSDVLVNERDLNQVSEEVHGLKTEVALQSQRIEVFSDSLKMIAESQKQIVELVAESREQRQINTNLEYKISQNASSIENLSLRFENISKMAVDNREKLLNIGWKVSIIIGIIYYYLPESAKFLPG